MPWRRCMSSHSKLGTSGSKASCLDIAYIYVHFVDVSVSYLKADVHTCDKFRVIYLMIVKNYKHKTFKNKKVYTIPILNYNIIETISFSTHVNCKDKYRASATAISLKEEFFSLLAVALITWLPLHRLVQHRELLGGPHRFLKCIFLSYINDI